MQRAMSLIHIFHTIFNWKESKKKLCDSSVVFWYQETFHLWLEMLVTHHLYSYKIDKSVKRIGGGKGGWGGETAYMSQLTVLIFTSKYVDSIYVNKLQVITYFTPQNCPPSPLLFIGLFIHWTNTYLFTVPFYFILNSIRNVKMKYVSLTLFWYLKKLSFTQTGHLRVNSFWIYTRNEAAIVWWILS